MRFVELLQSIFFFFFVIVLIPVILARVLLGQFRISIKRHLRKWKMYAFKCENTHCRLKGNIENLKK